MIHPLAEVASGTVIGAGTRVWQFASVIRGAEIGEDCNIASCAIVDAAKVGDRCLIGHGAQVHPGAVLEDEVFFGPGAVACNDAFPRVAKGEWDIGAFARGLVSVRLKRGSSIGANAVILPGVTVGEEAFVAAGVVCRQDVPAHHMLKRCGAVVEINRAWALKRMRCAGVDGRDVLLAAQ